MSYTEIQEIIDCKFWMAKWFVRANWLQRHRKTKCLWNRKTSLLAVLFSVYLFLWFGFMVVYFLLIPLNILSINIGLNGLNAYLLLISPILIFVILMGTLHITRIMALKLRRPLGDEDFCTANSRLSGLPSDAVLFIRNMLAKAYNMPSQLIYPQDTGRSLRKFSLLYGPFVWEIAPQLLLPGFRGNNNPDKSMVEQKINMILCMKDVESIIMYLAQDVEANSAYSDIFLGGLEDGMGGGE